MTGPGWGLRGSSCNSLFYSVYTELTSGTWEMPGWAVPMSFKTHISVKRAKALMDWLGVPHLSEAALSASSRRTALRLNVGS